PARVDDEDAARDGACGGPRDRRLAEPDEALARSGRVERRGGEVAERGDLLPHVDVVGRVRRSIALLYYPGARERDAYRECVARGLVLVRVELAQAPHAPCRGAP